MTVRSYNVFHHMQEQQSWFLLKQKQILIFFFPNKSSRMTVRVFLTFFIIYFLKIIKLLHNFQESLKDNPEKNFLKKISSGNPNRPTGSVFF